MQYDLTTTALIIGGGPAGLACAIKLKQNDPALQVTVLDKAAMPGGHLVSGAVMDPCALDELWPEWQEIIPHEKVTADKISFLTKSYKISLPPIFNEKRNVIISINQLGAHMADYAMSLGVDVLYGFAATDLIGEDHITGVICTDGTKIGTDHLILAEGCFGNLSEQVITRFNLRDDRQQTYGLGVKEIWQVQDKHFQRGLVEHTMGWPLPDKVHGGGWMYHYGDNLVSLGLITALDYDNPYISPFDEMQLWKTHPKIAPMLEGATRLSYQARTLVEGGLQSLPKLDFPGGMLIGDAAGFLNAGRIKGIHMAIRSGMLAAQAIQTQKSLDALFIQSPLYEELYKYRNVRPGFRYGRIIGLMNAGAEILGTWRGPFTFPAPTEADRKHYKPKTSSPRPYPTADHKLTFDKLSSVALCAMSEPEGDNHLLLTDPQLPKERSVEPAPYYCPAGVYEFANSTNGEFVINYKNCIHCKTCAIKDPDGNIRWTPNSGGSGPSYESI